MATKTNPGRYGAYAKALPDEPLFELLARDLDADKARMAWIVARLERIRDGKKPSGDLLQVKDAIDDLYRAQQWRIEQHKSAPFEMLVPMPGPADRAWINEVLNRLAGKRPETAEERLADDQGIRPR